MSSRAPSARPDQDSSDPNGLDAPFEVLAPGEQVLPVVLASPHSGCRYPQAFLDSARLSGLALRKSEDTFVDEVFAQARTLGVPMIRALFPRAFLDLNREPFELDPEMFEDALPAYANTRSPRVQAGLGTIARVVATGEEIYSRKLRFDEVLDRVNRYYHPYHAALKDLVERTRRRFGWCVLLDCHSMPSAGAMSEGNGRPQMFDLVLGDCFGSACARAVTDTAEEVAAGFGYTVARNSPYAGGHTTRHYGRPRLGAHALQIEINRSLYMDEARFTRKPHLSTLADHMTALVEAIGRLELKGAWRP
ncbi:MAG TPA: N-formylglutamate amidohydrolase [Azospirillaceae bacterium]|nr:N-formylglutamate amidohydrolase [Azospirillaceae bacterium]